jgi:hypothetical protein
VATIPAPFVRFGQFALWAALLLGSSCGSPQLENGLYRNEELAFRIGPVPSNWRRLDADEAALAFRDDGAGATIAVNGRCGKDGDDVPLEALTHHLFLHFTDRQVVSQQTVELDERKALRTEIIAELDGVPKRYTVYVLKKDGCVYDFLHISTLEASEASRHDFERFVKSFSTIDPA